MKIGRKYTPPLVIMFASLALTAYAASVLFTQTFPTVPAVGGIVANCVTLESQPATVFTGSTGFIRFRCPGGKPAFNQTSTATLAFIPEFTRPAEYTGVSIARISTQILATGGCSTLFTLISNGTALSIGPGTYDYCLRFANVPSTGLSSFNITWTA